MKINAEKPVVGIWLKELDGAAKGGHYKNLWKKIHRMVEVPSRKRPVVNLSKIEANTKDGDKVVVPGKVLFDRKISRKVTISAMEYSSTALGSLRDAGCSVIDLKDMLKEKGIKVIV